MVGRHPAKQHPGTASPMGYPTFQDGSGQPTPASERWFSAVVIPLQMPFSTWRLSLNRNRTPKSFGRFAATHLPKCLAEALRTNSRLVDSSATGYGIL